MIYLPKVITKDSLPNFRSNYCLTEMRKELKKREPDTFMLKYLLNGGKYDQPMH